MTHQEINFAIAKHLNPNSRMCAMNAPDFCNDLNAMHEAEEVLSGILGVAYRVGLDQLSDPLRATAAQRAEVFIKTLNLWK